MGKSKDGSFDILEKTEGGPANTAQMTGYVWKQVPMPVIAAMHGVAFGGGLQIALGADIRLAAPGTRFSVMEITWGIIPDMSITQTLRDGRREVIHLVPVPLPAWKSAVAPAYRGTPGKPPLP